MSSEILFLSQWKTSGPQRFWIFIKILIKEGLWLGQWDSVFRLSRPHGSLRITEGLVDALNGQNVPVQQEKTPFQNYQTAVVFKDVRNLRWAIQEKKAGRIARLLAGPFIATMPFEYNEILLSPEIDGLIFLSSWHRDLFEKEASKKIRKTFIWPAGVDPEKWQADAHSSRDRILIFIKQAPRDEIAQIQAELEKRGLQYETITYGAYTQEQYRKALGKAQFVIFLHQSETQGLATFEAWSMDRPTLHWNPGVLNFLGKSYIGASSCPYLSPELGLDFKAWQDFPATLDQMNESWRKLNPRRHILEQYSWEHSVRRFCEIINEKEV